MEALASGGQGMALDRRYTNDKLLSDWLDSRAGNKENSRLFGVSPRALIVAT